MHIIIIIELKELYQNIYRTYSQVLSFFFYLGKSLKNQKIAFHNFKDILFKEDQTYNLIFCVTPMINNNIFPIFHRFY